MLLCFVDCQSIVGQSSPQGKSGLPVSSVTQGTERMTGELHAGTCTEHEQIFRNLRWL